LTAGDKLFAYGISLVLQGCILYGLSPWIYFPTLDAIFCGIILCLAALSLAYPIYTLASYIRDRIVIRSPLEPLLLSVSILVPLYMIMVHGLIRVLIPYVFDKIDILELYTLATIIPTIIIIVSIYIVSS